MNEGLDVDVVVVGAGLAGLSASIAAARTGASVVLVDARDEIGGRARSDRAGDAIVNHGPHALYSAGEATRLLREYGVSVAGSMPLQRGFGWWRHGERRRALDRQATGGLLGVTTLLHSMRRRCVDEAQGRSLRQWLDAEVPADARPLVEMMLRTTTYAADPDHTDAAAALAQLRRGARGVRYLDGGWQRIVDGLVAVALELGVRIEHDRVVEVTAGDEAVRVSASHNSIRAGAVVVATGGPGHAHRLTGQRSEQLGMWAKRARPVQAYCLEVVLASRTGRGTALYGTDVPLYLVDHATDARLAPDSQAVLHGLIYEPDLCPDLDPRAELETALDAVEPGWRDRTIKIIERRRMVVAHDRPQPHASGADTPQIATADLPGVWFAGDWITAKGWLADAAMSSGDDAGRAAATRATATTAAPSPLPFCR